AQGAGEFADLCVKCGTPANGYRLKRELYWHTPALYVLFLLAWIGDLVVALMARKRATVFIGLCDRHRAARKNALSGGSPGTMLGLGSWGLGLDSQPEMMTGGVLLVVGCIVYGIVRARMIYPTRMDEQYVFIRGVGDAYPSRLPPFLR